MYMAGRIVGTQLYGFLLDRSDFTLQLEPKVIFIGEHVVYRVAQKLAPFLYALST